MTIPFKVLIPSRFASQRLPGKPLRMIAGKSLIRRVVEQAHRSGAADVRVATDDARIAAEVERFGGRSVMTRADHESGTDRIAEAATAAGFADDDIVVNLQGDEPLMDPALLATVAAALALTSEASVATLATPVASVSELLDPSAVKVVIDAAGFALYFSRAPIPWCRDEMPPLPRAPERLPRAHDALRHLGVYAYRVGDLRRISAAPACALERAEVLEQLRVLWLGLRLHVSVVAQAPHAGVDTEEDLLRVEAMLADSVRSDVEAAHGG